MLEHDTVRVRVLHTSPDAPAVDITDEGGDILIETLEFPNARDYREIPAASCDLEARPTGTIDVSLELPAIELESTLVYDVFAVGQVGDGSLTVLVVPFPTMDPEATLVSQSSFLLFLPSLQHPGWHTPAGVFVVLCPHASCCSRGFSWNPLTQFAHRVS